MGVFQNLTALITLKDNTQYGTRSVVSNLNRIAAALDVTHLAATKTFKIDNDIRRMGVQMGLASDDISRLTMSIVTLSNNTGVSTEKVTELTAAYAATGRTLKENDAGALKHMQTMTELAGRFGWSAAEAVKADVTLAQLGTSVEALTKDVTGLQKRFQIPGMIAQIPKVTLFAEQMLTRFGKTTVGNLNQIIAATLKTSATYARAFGVDAARALQMAQQQQEHFLTQMQHGRDVFLGLEEDFGGLHKSFFETGRGLDEVNRLLELGQKDPAAYAREVLRIRDNYKALGQGLFAERFFQNVIRNSDEATRSLLTNEEALKALEEANSRKEVTGSFDELAEGIRSIGTEVVNTVSNLMFLGKTIIGLTFLDEVTDSFMGITELLQNFNKAIVDGAKALKDSKTFQDLRPVLVGIGKVLIGVGAAAGMVAATFASAVIPFRVFMKIAEGLPVIGNAVSPVRALVGSMVAFVKQGANFAGIGAAMAIALEDFGAALKDPNLSLPELVLRGVRGMSLGIVEAFDNVLGGLPTTLYQAFFKTKKTLGESVRNMFRDLQLALRGSSSSMVGGWWKSIREEVGKQFDVFVTYLRTSFSKLQTKAATWGENIGRAVGTMAKWAVDLIAPLFSAKQWGEWIHTVVDFIRGDGKIKIDGAFGEIFDIVLAHGKTFTRNFIDEALRPFGLGFAEVQLGVLELFDSLEDNFDWLESVAWPQMERAWLKTRIALTEGFYDIQDAAYDVRDAAYLMYDAFVILGNYIVGPGGLGIAVWTLHRAFNEVAISIAAIKVGLDGVVSTFATSPVLFALLSLSNTAQAQPGAGSVGVGAEVKPGVGAEVKPGVGAEVKPGAGGRVGVGESSRTGLDDARTRLKEIEAGIEGQSTGYERRAAGRGLTRTTRRRQAEPKIRQRNFDRSQEDVGRRIDSTLAHFEGQSALAETDRVLAFLQPMLEEARTSGNAKMISGTETYINRFKYIRGKLAGATTPEEVTRVRNELRSYLDRDEGGRGIAERLNIGLDETTYVRPTEGTPQYTQSMGAEEKAMLTEVSQLLAKQAQIQSLTGAAQNYASQGQVAAAAAMLQAAQAIAESARKLQEAAQGAHTSTG